MKRELFCGKIVVRKSSLHGYGVFAEKTFKKGEIIEECYMIVTRGGDKKLENFYFDADGKYGLLTGFGSIYNHADTPNADYKINTKKCLATIKAERKIKKGEEIFVSYGEEWFTTRRIKPKKIFHNEAE